jgi:hypothetical protein
VPGVADTLAESQPRGSAVRPLFRGGRSRPPVKGRAGGVSTMSAPPLRACAHGCRCWSSSACRQGDPPQLCPCRIPLEGLHQWMAMSGFPLSSLRQGIAPPHGCRPECPPTAGHQAFQPAFTAQVSCDTIPQMRGIQGGVRHAPGGPEVTNEEWASPVPWAEAVARGRGRAKYNSIRKLRAKLRHLAIVRRVRQIGFRRGVQRQLAQELGVVPSIICTDLRQILARGIPAGYAGGTQQRTGGSHRPHRPTKEIIMGERVTVRLPLSLKAQLAAMAQREGQDLSAVIRRLVQHAKGARARAPAPFPRWRTTPPRHPMTRTPVGRYRPESLPRRPPILLPCRARGSSRGRNTSSDSRKALLRRHDQPRLHHRRRRSPGNPRAFFNSV